MLGVSGYGLVLFLHIGAVIALVGHTLGAPLVHAAIREAEKPGELARWLGFARRSARWNPAAALVLLTTGIYLGSWGWWTQSWFALAIVAWIVNSFLAKSVIQRSAGALMAAASRAGDDAISPEMERLRYSRPWTVATQAIIANDISILYVMIDKPEIVQAAAIMIAAHAVLIGTSLARHSRLRTAKAGSGRPPMPAHPQAAGTGGA